MITRLERDMCGELQVPGDALYGIAGMRAREVFSIAGQSCHPVLLRALGAVKLACLRTNHALDPWPTEIFEAMSLACKEVSAGQHADSLATDALQGGAGTSLHLTICEVIANRALQILQHPCGAYHVIDPLGDVNRHQSTNDVYPTATRVAALWLLAEAERSATHLLEAFQEKERLLDDVVKVGRTELQDAVLITLGREMAAYADACGRDRWRLQKAAERLRVVNLGGTAIGTGLGAPRRYIFRVVDELRDVTGLPLARAENLVDATQNCDPLVETMGILKTWASNLFKIANDLRLLSSGPSAGFGEILLPAKQAGSSIMPGKINPVVPEAVMQAAMMVMGWEHSLSLACSMGSLELNPFMPLVAETLLRSCEVLGRAARTLADHCVLGMVANRERCAEHVENSTAVATALSQLLGYHVVVDLIQEAKKENKTLRTLCVERGLLTQEAFERLIAPSTVLALGDRTEKRS